MNHVGIPAVVFGLAVFLFALGGCAATRVGYGESAAFPPVVEGQRGAVHEWAIDNDASAILSLSSGDPRVNARDENGWTPLHWAAEFGNAEAIEALLARGANVGARSKNDGSDVSEKTRRTVIEKGLYTAGELENVGWTNNGETALHLAAYSDNRRVILALLEAGADVYQRDGVGASPLHGAAWADAGRAVYELVAHGANVDARGEHGETPMHRAAGKGAITVIHELAIQGADVNARDQEAATPLHWAVRYAKPEAMIALSGRGADIEARSINGYTPLHWAVAEKNYEAIIMLVGAQADINAQTDKGYTALHLAVENNDWDAIEGFCKLGANADFWDVDGDTPLHLAALRDFTESIRALIQACAADVNIQNRREETPLDLAINEDNQAAMGELQKHNAQRGPRS